MFGKGDILHVSRSIFYDQAAAEEFFSYSYSKRWRHELR
jgi:hypothetical protein